MTARRVQLLCAWCGPVMVALLGIGLVLLAGFMPPPHPTDSAGEIRSLYLDDLTQIRIGLCLMMAGVALIVPWGAAIAAQTNRIRTGTPVLTYTQLGCVAVATMIGVASVIAWGAASFRPDDVSPGDHPHLQRPRVAVLRLRLVPAVRLVPRRGGGDLHGLR